MIFVKEKSLCAVIFVQKAKKKPNKTKLLKIFLFNSISSPIILLDDNYMRKASLRKRQRSLSAPKKPKLLAIGGRGGHHRPAVC